MRLLTLCIFVGLCLFFIRTELIGQATPADSLMAIWEDENEVDSIRFQAFHDVIFYHNVFVNPDSSIILANSLVQQARDQGDLYWEGKSLRLIGIAYMIKSAYERSLIYFNSALSKYQMAEVELPKAECYSGIGLCHHFAGDYINAIKQFQKGLDVVEKNNVFNRVRWAILGNLSKIYEEIGDYDEAIASLEEVIEKANEKNIVVSAYHSMASVYAKMGEYDKAEPYLKLAIEENTGQNNSMALAFSQLDLGKLKINQAVYTEAESALLIAQNLFEKLGNQQFQASAYAQLGILSYHQQRYQAGLDWCKKADRIVMGTKFLDVKEQTCECLYLNWKKLNQHEAALENLERLNVYRDSLLNLEKVKNAAKLQVQFAFDLEKAALENQKNEAILQAELEQSNLWFRFAIVIGSLLILMTVLGAMVFYYNKRKAEEHNHQLTEKNNELIGKNKELERFAFITSHDLKEPVRSISIFTDLLRRRIDQPEREEYLDYIKKASKKMYELIESIMAFTKVNNQEEKMEEVDMMEVLESVKTNLHQRLEERQVALNYQDLPAVTGMPNQLHILLQNLIGNAIKYNDKEKPEVLITCEEKKDAYQFCVEDNGMGMEAKYFKKVFEPFTRLDSKFEGAGLGLSITKNIVKHHEGQIWIDSELGKGSRFYFTINKGLDKKQSIALEEEAFSSQ